MKDMAIPEDEDIESSDNGVVLKTIFEGMGRLANIMPEEVGYIFLPKLKEKILTEKELIYKNVRVQNVFKYLLKNFQSVELSLTLFQTLIQQNLANEQSLMFLEALQKPVQNFTTLNPEQRLTYQKFLSSKCIGLIQVFS